MKKKKISNGTLNKWHRLAYEFEYDASRLKAKGFEAEADAIRSIASKLGQLVRSIEYQE